MFVVLGLGKSGKAAAALLLQKGKSVLGLDIRFPQEDEEIVSLQKQGMRYASDSSLLDESEVECLILSPGISPEHPIYMQAKARTPIVSEIALALQYLSQPMVAITGTNGKTTVTVLVEHVLNECGFKARALGNSGYPLSTYVLEQKRDEILVIELSSFQLELLQGSYFDAAAIVNITPDHLDRYSSMEAYAGAKCRIEQCMKPEAPLFVNANISNAFSRKVIRFTSSEENWEVAWRLCNHFGVARNAFERACACFVALPHRIAFVKEIAGVKYFDDSKGTNVAAVIKAVDTMTSSVILLVGGVDKGASFHCWADAFAGKVKRIIAFGSAKEKIMRELAGQFEMEPADTLLCAVKQAHVCAQPGDCVLLSPGCASTDQFRDYVHRGIVFQRIVQEELL